MEELLANSSSVVKGFKRGQKIEARLIEVGPKFAILDVGGKSEGVILDSYFSEARDYLASLKPGETVHATVIDPETRDGSVLLSLRHAANDMFWDNLEKIRENDEVVWVIGRAASPKGVAVDLDSTVAFIPLSQIGKKTLNVLEDLVGKRFKAKILEIDKSKRRVLLSEKAVSEEREIKEEKEALSHIEEGAIYNGVVKEVTSFGAFVEIKLGEAKTKVPVEGLVHVSELSWQKVKEPSSVLSVGDSVRVKVIGLRDGKLALSVKQALDDPWTTLGEKYRPDMKVKGRVIRSSDFGTFVELEPGIEGLVHITKIPPATKLTPGSEVEVYIEELDKESKKISLGLVLTSKPVGYK